MEEIDLDEKNNQKEQKHHVSALYVILVVGALAVCGICMFVLPQRTYSENENRYLTTFPKLSTESIQSGEAQQALTEAAADQFPMRDAWMKLSMGCKYLLCKREANGIYVGADGQLFEKKLDSDLSMDNYRTNLQYVTAMAQTTDADVSVMLIPSAATILSDKLPTRAVSYDATPYEEQGMLLCEADSVRWIQTKEALTRAAHDGAKVYFSTDHHWTTYGAYAGANTYLEASHRQTQALSAYDVQTASEGFYGTLYSRIAGMPQIKAEKLELPQNLPEELLIETDGAPADAVRADGTHAMPELTGIYDLEKLDTKDKYAVYFGGNYGRLTIRDPKAEGAGKLLIIKDSYVNSMVPYLCGDYEQITMLDLRYYNASVPELLTEGWDEILVCYEMSNFIIERNIFKLIR